LGFGKRWLWVQGKPVALWDWAIGHHHQLICMRGNNSPIREFLILDLYDYPPVMGGRSPVTPGSRGVRLQTSHRWRWTNQRSPISDRETQAMSNHLRVPLGYKPTLPSSTMGVVGAGSYKKDKFVASSQCGTIMNARVLIISFGRLRGMTSSIARGFSCILYTSM
jgi:hypothetical protein